ncbi:hypothetical protein O988_02652 [Pseudogymnoascus sp. VKM F-3808]|nr:hypothetical protein O988_02652 [Pseudogymnoascus sp. VKM F-3808]
MSPSRHFQYLPSYPRASSASVASLVHLGLLSSLLTVRGAFDQFRPKGYEDIGSPPMQTHLWKEWALVDNQDALMDSDPWQLGGRVATAGNEGGRIVMCEFRRWAGHFGATLEREEATVNSPLTRESWAQKLAEVMPPVTAWAKERWDIQLVPRQEEEEEGEDEDPEFTRKLEEFVAGVNE